MEKLSVEKIEDRLKSLEGWEYVNDSIETSFEFKNFKEAFTVMTRWLSIRTISPILYRYDPHSIRM